MSAIEYGSTYWGVVLQSLDPNIPGETVHLHADAMKIDPTGALTFTSVGRRPAGTWPPGLPAPADSATKKSIGSNGAASSPSAGSNASESNDKDSDQGGSHPAGAGDTKKPKADTAPGTVYVAFAPGTWKTVYAAKLQDGAPAAIEHWSTLDGKQALPELTPANSGASGQPQQT
jgi:hypothetical protein